MNRSEEYWALASSIQLTLTHEGIEPGCDGVIGAERNPTGWFIWARFNPELSAEQVEDFAHFVVVRTYLLLEYGPQPGAWVADADGAYRAYCPSLAADVQNLRLIT